MHQQVQKTNRYPKQVDRLDSFSFTTTLQTKLEMVIASIFNRTQFSKETVRSKPTNSQTTASKLTFFSFPKLAIAEDTTKHCAQNHTSTKVTKLSTPTNANVIHTTSLNINIKNKKQKNPSSAQKQCLNSIKNRKNASRVWILPFSSKSTTRNDGKGGRKDQKKRAKLGPLLCY